MSKITPVILSGGSGSRLWPSSRSLYPKQFLKLVSDQTMLQETVSRLNGLDGLSSPVVVANNEHRFLVAEQLKEIDINDSKIILEPTPKNTAPAIALAALSVEGEDVILVLPADHIIENIDGFHQAIKDAMPLCESGNLVTFSIVPSSPEIGYGYIKAGKSIGSAQAFEVAEFVEKPSLEIAKQYLENGQYSWNSGMFMFKASVFLSELKEFEAEMVKLCESSIRKASSDIDFIRVDETEFGKCMSNSIDYAVMEKTTKGVVMPLDVGWNDIGSWSALWQQLEKDENGNVLDGDVIVNDVKNSFIKCDKKLIAAVGVEDIVLVETDDSILLAKKDCVQDVKSIVNRLVKDDRPEAELHRKVYRPWGFYDSIENGDGFQVKRLVVYPGAQLSLQMHYHRAEHWVVVKGTAEIVNGEDKILLGVNESTYIPIGAKHQLSNPGKMNLELIEVQSGSYLGEDDIVRFEDVYGRV